MAQRSENQNNKNKKVLLRERKRHTAHCEGSTGCAALSNPDLVLGGGGTWSTPPDLEWGTPQTWDGVPPQDLGLGTPPQTWDWVPLTWDWVPPRPGPGMGYPHPYLDLRWGTPPTQT